MLRGDEIWCQLFSEPNAGSDVAAAQLRARRDGDEWVLDGQKVWTSSADRAAFGMCIARTDHDVPKHRGLTMFIVPMHADGITIRPLVQANGAAGFNEVFFDEVRLSDDAQLGDVGSGWSVTISMLMNERVSLGASGNSLLTGSTVPVLAARFDYPADRSAVSDLWVREEVQRIVALRVRSAVEGGRDPGPTGSIAKLLGSDLVRRASNEHMRIRGAAAMAWEAGDEGAEKANGAFLMSPSFSIAGGTSEIQRNIIGERVLGLPREPEVDRDVPFREVLQNRVAPRRGSPGTPIDDRSD
ncbi:MAG: acyl-CoA dehydrogenase family protein [Acidimicrobiia bacterium]